MGFRVDGLGFTVQVLGTLKPKLQSPIVRDLLRKP